MAQMQYNNKTGYYEAMESGQLVQVDSDVFAEALKDAQKEGKSYDQAFNELADTSLWTGSTPMDGVYVDGKAQ